MAKKTVLYIGEKEIKDIKNWLVIFNDGSQEKYTDTQLEYIVTKKPLDESQLRQLEVQQIAISVLETLTKHNVKKWLIDPIRQSVVWSYNDAFSTAVWKAFWTYEDGKHPENMIADITITDIQRLKKG